MSQLFFTSAYFPRDFAKARAQVLEEVNQILHGLNNFGYCKVIQHALALAYNLAHFALVEAQQQWARALQNPAWALDELFPVTDFYTTFTFCIWSRWLIVNS